jgi:acetyl-CoA acetyltransferase
LYEDAKDLCHLDTTEAVVKRLFEKTKLSINDINVAEVHDCFSIAELLMYEAIGLAEKGKGER